MKCPVFPEVLVQLYPLRLVKVLDLLKELPGDVDVGNRDVASNAPSMKEAVHLQRQHTIHDTARGWCLAYHSIGL